MSDNTTRYTVTLYKHIYVDGFNQMIRDEKAKKLTEQLTDHINSYAAELDENKVASLELRKVELP